MTVVDLFRYLTAAGNDAGEPVWSSGKAIAVNWADGPASVPVSEYWFSLLVKHCGIQDMTPPCGFAPLINKILKWLTPLPSAWSQCGVVSLPLRQVPTGTHTCSPEKMPPRTCAHCACNVHLLEARPSTLFTPFSPLTLFTPFSIPYIIHTLFTPYTIHTLFHPLHYSHPFHPLHYSHPFPSLTLFASFSIPYIIRTLFHPLHYSHPFPSLTLFAPFSIPYIFHTLFHPLHYSHPFPSLTLFTPFSPLTLFTPLSTPYIIHTLFHPFHILVTSFSNAFSHPFDILVNPFVHPFHIIFTPFSHHFHTFCTPFSRAIFCFVFRCMGAATAVWPWLIEFSAVPVDWVQLSWLTEFSCAGWLSLAVLVDWV